MKNFLTLFFVVFFSSVFSQMSEFSSVSADFPEEVKNFIEEYDKSLAKEYAKDLEKIWEVYPESQRQLIISLANKMIKKKVKLRPHFLHYFSSIASFGASSNYSSQGFDNWSGVVAKLLEARNTRRFDDFIEFSDPFFKELILSQSTSVTWRINGSYSFYEKNGGFVKLKNAKVVAFSKNDSSVIYKASGDFNITTQSFFGTAGTVTWERVEFPKDKTFAQLSSYRINMKTAGYDADSVLLHSPYFKNPEFGKLREKVVTFREIEAVRYPEFTSYNQEITLKEIAPSVDYTGEFTLVGASFKGGASGRNTASITILRKNKPFAKIESKNVDIFQNKIKSRKAKVTFFLANSNTITQNQCDVNYSIDEKELTVFKNEKSSVDYPFVSSYHQMAFHVGRIVWQEGNDFLELGSFESMGESIATFESVNYFSRAEFNSFSLGNTNLLKSLLEFQGGGENDTPLSMSDFASYNKVLLDDLLPYLSKMANKGLIEYSKDKNEIIITARAEPYFISSSKEGDYDDVWIRSSAKSKNGTIDLKSLSLTIEGIRNFDLSKKQFVRVYPKQGQIIVNKNRSLVFDGVINAGRTECFGSNLEFDYQEYTLNFLKLDSLRFRVYSMHDSIQSAQVRLLSKLNNVEGKIVINSTSNRSGIKKGYDEYPILSVNNSPRIYYNQSEILGGIYDTTSFYFEAVPFDMDSLLTFSNESLKFDGSIYTSEIFPPFVTSVTLMNDYVLGFDLKKVSEKIYSGNADYSDNLKLNREGLIGKGRFGFITSSAYSSKITFFPDSMVAKTGQYTNKSQTLPSVPEIIADNCLITFQPQKGIWKAKNLDVFMNIYSDGKSQFDGTIALQKEGMMGTGDFSSERIQVNSKEFEFSQNGLEANKANFTLNGEEENDPPALEAENMKMDLDFDKRTGKFIANSGIATIDFPANKFTAITDEFDWFMDKNQMDFKKVIDTANFQNYDENKNLKPNFISTLKEHQGLGFFSGFASYFVDSNILLCQEIPYIVVADSWIIPDGGKLKIKEKAELRTLYNSQILANFTNKYHHFTKAEISIFSSKEYLANGNYIVSSDPTINSKVFFDNIEPNIEGITEAKGKILMDSNFYLSPQFKYYGDILIKGSDIGATYDGLTKVITNCKELELDWIEFQAIVDTNKIIIPLGESFADKVSGPTIYNDGEISFYTAFLADKKFETDQAITPSEGFLSYNKDKGLFEIGAKEKLVNNKAAGNYISFDNENCSFNSIGTLNLFGANDQFSLEVVGEMSYNTLRDTVLKMNGTMKVDFPFNTLVTNQMSTEIVNTPIMQMFKLEKTNYDLFLNNTVSPSKSEQINNELFNKGRISRLPEELMSVITLFDLNFYWSEDLQSFVSNGNANVATIGENQLYKRCKVYVQIQKRRSGDKFALLIEHKENSFYYFDYFNGELLTYSTDKTYLELLEAIPAKEKKIKGEKDQQEFYFGISSKSKPYMFLDNFVKEDGFDED